MYVIIGRQESLFFVKNLLNYITVNQERYMYHLLVILKYYTSKYRVINKLLVFLNNQTYIIW